MKTLESSVYTFRMGFLSLNVLQEREEYIRVPVEENYFKPELLTHLLPVPALVVHVREGGVEEEGGDGLVSSSCIGI